MSDHHPFFRPSKLPALSQCEHYEEKEGVGPLADEGDAVHELTADLITGQEQLFNSRSPDILKKAAWLSDMVNRILAEVRGVEKRVEILNRKGEQITFGTADVWGYDEEDILTVIDHKRTNFLDRTPQFAAYALGLMQAQNEPHCRCVVLCYNAQEIYEYSFLLEEAQRIVWDLYDRVINKAQYHPRENDFCNWCAKQLTCPVWVGPANKAMEIVSESKILPLDKLLALRDDPEKCGEFFAQWRKAEALVKEAGIKEHIIELLEEDPAAVPGWALQNRKGRKVTDMALLKRCWEDHMKNDIPMTESAPTRALVRSKTE